MSICCLWKGCEFAFEEMAALQEHVITIHLQQQRPRQQQLNLANQNYIGMKEEQQDHGGSMAKNGKINEEKRRQNETQTWPEVKKPKKGIQRRKIILLAVEVWVDVLGFIKRIQLARSVCLANWKIYEICWPRLHGNKVKAHDMWNILIGYSDESAATGHPPTALLLKDDKKVPFPECPPPGYFTICLHIQINFLDYQVLAFLSLIASRIENVRFEFTKKMSHLDENGIASVNQLLQLCREKITTIYSIRFNRNFTNIQFLPDVDNKMKRIEIVCSEIEEASADIPILMQLLASPRADGLQRVINMRFWFGQLPVAQKLLQAITEEFRTSTQPKAQPFYIRCIYSPYNLNIPQSEEQNLHTNETLTIMPNLIDGNFDICRHPRGQHEQWAEDARKRLIEQPIYKLSTWIRVNISAIGLPFCSS